MFMTVLLSLVLPAMAGIGVLALCWFLPPLRKWNALAHSAFGFAIAAGIVASFAAEEGLPSFPPDQRADWVGLIAVIAAIIAFVLAFIGGPEKPRTWPMFELISVLVGGAVAALPWLASLVDDRSIEKFMFSDTTIADQVSIGLGITLGLLLLDRIAANRHGVTMPLVFWLVFAGLAVLAQESGWITLIFLSATAATVCFAAAFLAKFSGNPSIGRGGLTVAVILLAVLPVAGFRQTYGDFPWWCWGLVVGSPVVLLLFENPIVDRFPAWLQTTMRIVAVAIPIAIGVAIAVGAGAADDPNAAGFGNYGS